MKLNSKIILIILLIFLYSIVINRKFIQISKAIINNENKIVLTKRQQNIYDKNNIKVALCTMGKQENLYINEFIEYYLKLGIDHIFIYDDNDPGEEKISDAINFRFLDNVTIYDTKNLSIKHQSSAFTNCYNSNIFKYDWFLMVDIDEFLYIVNNTLKEYLKDKIFDKCDFIKFHWVLPTDNGLLYYDNRSLFKRFKPPYIQSSSIKTIIRGNISNLSYSVHSPIASPKRNITCNNQGKIIYYKYMNFHSFDQINIDKAYIIHFKFKSTQEFINKIKRGYNILSKEALNEYMLITLINYFKINNVTKEKIKFIIKELNLTLAK